ncbi:hypothetical protein [Aquimarina hainanensis]
MSFVAFRYCPYSFLSILFYSSLSQSSSIPYVLLKSYHSYPVHIYS